MVSTIVVPEKFAFAQSCASITRQLDSVLGAPLKPSLKSVAWRRGEGAAARAPSAAGCSTLEGGMSSRGRIGEHEPAGGKRDNRHRHGDHLWVLDAALRQRYSLGSYDKGIYEGHG